MITLAIIYIILGTGIIAASIAIDKLNRKTNELRKR